MTTTWQGCILEGRWEVVSWSLRRLISDERLRAKKCSETWRKLCLREKTKSQTLVLFPYQLTAENNLRMQKRRGKRSPQKVICEFSPLNKTCPPTKVVMWKVVRSQIYVPASKAAAFVKLFCTKHFVVRDQSNQPDTGTKCSMCSEITSGLLEMEKRHPALLACSPYGMVLPSCPSQAEATAVYNHPRVRSWC